eukprot:4831080-Amphidinium_carterae.2
MFAARAVASHCSQNIMYKLRTNPFDEEEEEGEKYRQPPAYLKGQKVPKEKIRRSQMQPKACGGGGVSGMEKLLTE